jgi:hypothetical protein
MHPTSICLLSLRVKSSVGVSRLLEMGSQAGPELHYYLCRESMDGGVLTWQPVRAMSSL